MIFKSTKSRYFVFITLLVVFALSAAAIFQLFVRNDLMVIIPFQVICWACIILLVWIYLATYYKLTADYLFYRAGPIFGKIKVDGIKEIVIGTPLFVGFKPAIGSDGLILKYNRWDEIYISPEMKEKFIVELLKLNTKIVVRDLKN